MQLIGNDGDAREASMQIVVTGGSGFVGTEVVRRLVRRGDSVTVVDLNRSVVPEAALVQGDLRDPEVVERALARGTDAVVHLAAMTSVLKSVADPDGVFRTNVVATHLCLERCREAGIPRMVFASTNAVVGDVGRAPINEEMVLRPLTPYGATKAAGEMLLRSYSASFGLVTGVLRFTNIYGRGMRQKDSVVARLMRAALAGGGIDVYGDGEQIRDYLYVTDAAAAIELALTIDKSDTLTIGGGDSVSLNDLHRITCEVTGVPIQARHVAAKAGEMPAVIVDISHAMSQGFRPEYDIRAGIEATWEDFSSAEETTPSPEAS